jgi:hypothetical protein
LAIFGGFREGIPKTSQNVCSGGCNLCAIEGHKEVGGANSHACLSRNGFFHCSFTVCGEENFPKEARVKTQTNTKERLRK